MGRPALQDRAPYDVDAITDIAVRVFNERGYDSSSMEHIAEAAGIRKASLYYHVRGKEDLFERGVQRAFDTLFGVLEEAGATEGSAIERLRYVLRRTVEVTVEKLPEASLVIRTRGNTKFEREILARRRAFDAEVAALVAKAAREGAARSDIPPAIVARLLMGMSNTLTEWFKPDGTISAQEIADYILLLTFSGLAPNGKPRAMRLKTSSKTTKAATTRLG